MTKNNKHGMAARSDAGNAELFATLYHDRVRFDHSRQRWLLYGVHGWQADVDGELMRMAKHTVRVRLHNCTHIS